MRRLQQESCGIPLLLDVHQEENFKKRPLMLITKRNDRYRLGDCGRSFLFAVAICCAKSSLDNPRGDVYNKDKERRCPHSGQLPLPMS